MTLPKLDIGSTCNDFIYDLEQAGYDYNDNPNWLEIPIKHLAIHEVLALTRLIEENSLKYKMYQVYISVQAARCTHCDDYMPSDELTKCDRCGDYYCADCIEPFDEYIDICYDCREF